LPAEIREHAAVIRRNAELEARLIDDLLDHSRITHGKLSLIPGAVDVHAILSAAEEVVKSESSGKGVRVVIEKHAAEHHVKGDAARLQQVFWNVMKNAVKFTPIGGEVCVRTSNEDDGRLLIRVTDTGIGIPADVLPRIFTAFEQGRGSNRAYGGLGLGLAITKGIVEMHHGTIHAESKGAGQGATFRIAFATIPAPAASAGAGDNSSLRIQRSLRLLIVEDHEATRNVLARLLARAGHEVQSVGTASAAVTLLETVGPFDAMISDLGLPDQSGLELVKRAREIQPSLSAVALSGYGMEEDVQRAKAAGFMAHLVKPVPLEQLHALLDQLPAQKK
jgi:CheY-like chemotaxis protein